MNALPIGGGRKTGQMECPVPRSVEKRPVGRKVEATVTLRHVVLVGVNTLLLAVNCNKVVKIDFRSAPVLPPDILERVYRERLPLAQVLLDNDAIHAGCTTEESVCDV